VKPWRPKQKRGSDAWFFLLLLLGAVIIGGYLWVQRRLGTGPLIGAQLTPTPAITLTPTRSIEENMAQAEAAVNDGNFRSAVALYDQLSRRRPNDVDLQVRAARLTAFLGQYPKAEQRARRILQINDQSNNAEVRALLCLALEYQQKLDAALAECQAAVTADPKNATAHAYLSEVYADKGDCASALGSAQQAAALEPQNPEALHKLGYYYEVCGQSYETALSYYQRALDLAPNMQQILMDEGRVYLVFASAGNAASATSAVETFQRILAMDNQSAEAYSRLGVAYMHQGEYGKSAEAHDKAVTLEPGRALLWTNRGWMQFRRRFWAEAAQDYTRALTTSLVTSETLKPIDFLRYGYALTEDKKCDEGLSFIAKAVEAAPADSTFLNTQQAGQENCQ
jgi:tetratricopeptide (TPR) repeat protein